MAIEGFDWALVQSFVAVFDAGSITKAARRSGARQPTLSRHLAELEEQLGAPLFERTGRGVTPTGLAIAAREAARQMELGASALSRAVIEQRDTLAGTVRVTTSQVAATYLLPPILAALHEASPRIQIELVASNDVKDLLSREADIAVRMVRPSQSAIVARKLADIPVGACAHERYLASRGTPRTWDDLAGHTLIGYDRDDTILRGFARVGIKLARERFAFRTDDQIAYGRLVAAGAGVGFVALYNTAHWPGVRQILPSIAVAPLPCWLAVRREVRASRVVRRVYDHLADAIPKALSAHT
jgi:DNA-binding transcriptional LysR family regulator